MKTNDNKLLGREVRRLAFLAAAVLLIAAPVLRADFLVGTTGSWQAFPATLDENGTPYFDSPSLDGSKSNIGYFLSGSGSFSNSPNVTPDWWGNTDGTADRSFYFSTSGSINGQLVLEVAGLKNANEIGWYDPSEKYPTLNPIFAGSASAGDSITFSPSNLFGLYIKNDKTFYTQSSRNEKNDKYTQHFVVFRDQDVSGTTYWVGVEDLPKGAFNGFEGSGDFNDAILKISATQVPEPGSMVFMGTGLLAISALIRRRRKANPAG